MTLLSRAASQLLVIDVQARLAPAMAGGADCVAQVEKLCAAAHALDIPVAITEHYPEGIGATLPSVLKAAPGAAVIRKMTFSCMREEAAANHINARAAQGRRQVVICGMESHVCVLQSALDLRAGGGGDVFAVCDAMASRQKDSRTIALQRMQQAGVTLVTFEMVAFEWLERAGTPQFKALLSLIK